MNSSNTHPVGTSLRLDMTESLAHRLTVLGDGISEYCYSNLYLFRNVHEYSLLESDYPCIAGTTYDGKRHLLPLFDVTKVLHNELLNILGDYDFFFPVSEVTMGRLDASRFVVSHSRDDADYLYTSVDFIHYHGDKLRKKKNLMNQYLKGGITEVFPFSSKHFEAAKQVLDCWQEEKNKAVVDTDYHPTLEALEQYQALGLIGFMHYRDRKPTGFLLGKAVWPGICAIHFAKGAKGFNGIYQYMFHLFATKMEGRFHHFNFEQDLGILNFRKTKMSYCPNQLLRKYRLKPIY